MLKLTPAPDCSICVPAPTKLTGPEPASMLTPSLTTTESVKVIGAAPLVRSAVTAVTPCGAL